MTPTVLLVDDNEKLRGLLRLSVEAYGGMSVVGEAADGASGIEAAGRLRPDVVLLDLAMPTMDGLEALGRIRKASPSSHVVILTGFRAERLDDVAAELGATAFLEKGLPPSQLADAIRRAMGSRLPPMVDLPEERREALARRVRTLV